MVKRKRKKPKYLNFKSWEAYRRWLAYGHATGVFERTPGHQKIKIRGKVHHPVHKRKKK